MARAGAGLAAFAATGVLALVLGQALFRGFRGAALGGMYHAAMATALAWLLVAVVAATPFLAVAWMAAPDAPAAARGFRDPADALFEAFSGITGTGLSVVADPSTLPRSLQWWRSLMEWVGGLGIVVAIVAVFQHGAAGYRLFRSEAREDTILPSVRSTVRRIGLIYVAFTALAVVGLLAAGRPPWEALNHGLTTISTGGFTITPDSLAGYDLVARTVAMAAMIAGAVSFQAHSRVIADRRPREMLRRGEHRALWAMLLAGSGLAILLVPAEAVRTWSDPVFNWVSAATTAGLSTTPIAEWSVAAKLLLVIGMTIGGEAGATVGGLKLGRLVMVLRGLAWRLADVRRTPHEVTTRRIDGEPVREDAAHARVRAAAMLVALWLGCLALATLALAAIAGDGRPLEDVLLETASAQGNVGLSVGIVSRELGTAAKALLCLVMWLGRLEIIPVLVLASSFLVAPRRQATPEA